MPWFKVDDAFHSHPKVMGLSPAAVGVWTLAGAWSANYLTDGEVQANILRRFGGTSEMIQELCDSGLWIDNGDGTYQFKDWSDYQPVKADVDAEREAARERMRQVRAKKKGTDGASPVRANASRTTEEVRVTPTQPVPSRPEGSKEPSTDAPSPEFDAFWSAFPSERKANKPGCRKKFAQAAKTVDPQKIISAAAAYRDDPNREAKYTVSPHRWLNEERWESGPLPAASSNIDQRRMENLQRLSQREPWDPSQQDPNQWGNEGVRALGR